MSPQVGENETGCPTDVTVTNGKPLPATSTINKSDIVCKSSRWSSEKVARLRKEFVPPDGGYAWFIAFGAFMAQFWIAGLTKSYGIIFVEVLQLFPDASASLASWIPAMRTTFCFIFSPVVSALCTRFSCRSVVFVGGLFSFAGLTLSFFATSLTELWFGFGVLGGIGAGLSLPPGIIMTSQYFTKHRALASGICLSGASAGSILLPFLIGFLRKEYGFLGSTLILGACMLHVCLVACLYRPLEVHQWIVEVGRRKIDIASDPELKAKAGRHVCIEQKQQLSPESDIKLEAIPGSRRPHEFSHYEECQMLANGDEDRVVASTAKDRPTSASYLRKERSHITTHSSRENLNASPEKRESLESLSPHNANGSPHETSHCQQITEEHKHDTGCYPSLRRYIDISLVKDPLFMLVSLTVMLVTTGYPNVLFYVPAYSNMLGYSKTDAGWLISVSAIFDLAGGLLSGFITDLNLFKRSHGYFVTMAVSAVAVLCMSRATNYWVLASLVAMYGLAIGAWCVYIPILLTDYYGVESIASAYGLIRMFQGAMLLAVPPFAGFLRDETGTYIACFLFMGVCMSLGACTMCFEPCVKKLSDKRHEACKESAGV